MEERHSRDVAVHPIEDCWNKIGVRGDGSCPELKRYAQCRNCPVYSRAAVSLLDRDIPGSYRAEWTNYFSAARKVEETDKESAFIFRVGAEWLAISTLAVDEVAEMRAVHTLPHRRNGLVLGLANVRGELLVCVSLTKLLDLDAAPTRGGGEGTQRRLLVLRQDGKRMVSPVDEVHGVHLYPSNERQTVPATVSQAASYTEAVLPWRNKTVGYLDSRAVMRALAAGIA